MLDFERTRSLSWYYSHVDFFSSFLGVLLAYLSYLSNIPYPSAPTISFSLLRFLFRNVLKTLPEQDTLFIKAGYTFYFKPAVYSASKRIFLSLLEP